MGRSDLDWDAVDDADDRFYANHPELTDANGKRIPLSRNDPKQKHLREEWWRLYEEEKAKNARPPDDPPDDEDPVNPCDDCDDNKPDVDCQPIAAVTLDSLSFENDHAKLKDEFSEWTNTGSTFPHPDWRPTVVENPVSITMGDKQPVTIAYLVADEDACPETGEITFSDGALVDGAEKPVTFSTTKAAVTRKIASMFTAPMRLARLDPFVSWTAKAGSDHDMGLSTNTIFSTWGPSHDSPFAPSDWRGYEDGATYMRMETAMEWAEPAGSIDEIEVIKHIFGQFTRYVLGIHTLSQSERDYLLANPDELDKITKDEWPSYYLDGVGTWLIHENQNWGAECQAICRFCRAVMRQLGAKSKLEFRTYTADFADPETVIDAGKPKGPRADRKYTLADRPVKLGETYWTPLPGEGAKVGWNNFEAYLKVTPEGGGDVQLFGGGLATQPLASGYNPLHVFYGIVEYEVVSRKLSPPVNGKDNQSGRKITGVHVYDKKGGWSGNLP